MRKDIVDWANGIKYIKSVDEENNKIIFNNGSYLIFENEEVASLFLNFGKGNLYLFAMVDFYNVEDISIDHNSINGLFVNFKNILSDENLLDSFRILIDVFNLERLHIC